MKRITDAFRGHQLKARVLRSAAMLMLGYGGSQALRLASNLILTRILFPEAFGLMALVNVVIVGLSMFSDVGIGPAISQSRRGDDPDFLDTAFTIQFLRGIGLWAATWLLAWPVAGFYGEPDLALYLPIAGLSMVVAGLNPTRIETAYRHLYMGRLTLLDLAAQAIALAIMVVLALITRSVIALVLGSLLQAAIRLALTHFLLPGHRNRFRWDQSAARELLGFGKWIFLSTAFWFVTSQGDRAILGRFLSLEMLGLYNIAYFLASFPTLLGHSVNNRLMIPVYRDKPAAAAPENRRKQRLLRSGLTAAILGLSLAMAYAGPALVGLLYDPRYLAAGPLVTLIALAYGPAIIGMTYDQAALSAGDSRSFFVYSALRALAQVALILAGVHFHGLLGAIAAIALAQIVTYPVLIWLARRHQVWDGRHDALAALAGLGLGAGALWLHWDRIAPLLAPLGR